MKRRSTFSLFLLSLLMLGCTTATPQSPVVEVVTMVVTGTPLPTYTPVIVTEVETVVVTVTPVPSATGRVTATPVEDQIPNSTGTPLARVVETVTPAATPEYKYPMPQLSAPEGGATFVEDAPVLRWEALPLEEDEYYEVTIERLWQELPYYAGSTWAREAEYALPLALAGTSDTGHFTWWVTVKRQTGENASGNKVGEAISPPSEQRTFTWSQE